MSNPQPNIILAADAQSNTGRVRENNEDSVLLWSRENIALAVVADGMGGAVAGEEASRIAVQTFYKTLLTAEMQAVLADNQISAHEIGERLKGVIALANHDIFHQSDVHPHLRGMGTTVTTAFVSGTHAVIGHVGDSRAYLVQGDTRAIEQITVDHSFVEAMVMAGHITRAEAEDHPMRNILYRVLGQSLDLDIDLYDIDLQVGDRLILCSDGLTLHVHPAEIAETALNLDTPEAISKQLIDLANIRGGKDNVSVVVIAVGPNDENATRSSKVVLRGRQHTGSWLGADSAFSSSESSYPIHLDDPDPVP